MELKLDSLDDEAIREVLPLKSNPNFEAGPALSVVRSLEQAEATCAAMREALKTIIDTEQSDCSYHDKYILAKTLARHAMDKLTTGQLILAELEALRREVKELRRGEGKAE